MLNNALIVNPFLSLRLVSDEGEIKAITLRAPSDAAQRSLVERRYVALPELIQPVQLAAIRHYYRELIREGFVQFGDSEWPNRFFPVWTASRTFFSGSSPR
jgi:hypothetical protein